MTVSGFMNPSAGTWTGTWSRFVNDYKIKLFETAWLEEEQAAGFKSNFRIVADYFVQMQKNGSYNGSVQDVRHMREVLQLMSVLVIPVF